MELQYEIKNLSILLKKNKKMGLGRVTSQYSINNLLRTSSHKKRVDALCVNPHLLYFQSSCV